MEIGMVLFLPVHVSLNYCYDNSKIVTAIDCGPQPTPDPNGKIESTQGTSLGDQTTYACNPGFFLKGTKTIYCQNDGKYSDDAPLCKRKF